MKTPTNTNTNLGISVLLLTCTILLISCGGCRSSKVNTEMPDNTSDVIPILKQDYGSNIDTIDKVVYVNDSTHTYKDITITNYYVANTRLIKFPEGKTLSDAIDNPIIKEIPKKYIVDWDHIKSSPTYGVIDIKAMDMKTKKRWFSKMDGMRNINKLTRGFYNSGISVRYKNKGIILKYTSIEVEEEIQPFGNDWIYAYVGNVSIIEVYDLKGNKMYEINADKYGGDPICITDDNKYLIIHAEGKDESDRWIFKNASVSIYHLSDGKLFQALLMPEYASTPGCGVDYLSITTNNTDLDTILRINIVIEKNQISTLQLQRKNLKDYLGAIEDGNFKLKNGTIISNGSVGFNQYTFDEWNKLMMLKKENLND